jgi:AraC-like DNA-binding protein
LTDLQSNKYYITDVDKFSTSIYCYHDVMGELLIPTHIHDKDQLLYTEGGIVYVVVNNQRYYLPPRHFMWIPAGVEHSIHPSSEKIIMRNLYFPVYRKDAIFFKKVGIYPINQMLLEMLLYTQRYTGNLFQSSDDYHIVKSLKLVLPKVTNHDLPLILPYPKDKRLMEIIDYIDLNLSQNVYLPQLANQFTFTEKTLSRLFKKDLNMTFVQYITTRRILKFIELVIDKNYSISNASIAVGYMSLPTFSNTFHKFMKQRPSEYFKERKIKD